MRLNLFRRHIEISRIGRDINAAKDIASLGADPALEFGEGTVKGV